jgi:hypothetical protein
MNRISSQAGRLALCAVALVFCACSSFGDKTDEGANDVVHDTAVDNGGNPDDIIVADTPHDLNGDTREDVARDTAGDEVEPVDARDANQPDTNIPDASGDDVKDVEDINIPDTNVPESDACIPQCGSLEGGDLRECGDDGCDDVCGWCKYGFACDMDAGKCVEICIPDCLTEGKVCGDDGCTGSCGECGINYKCGPDSQCYPDVCESNCVADGLECGLDKCGDSCGECGESEVCSVGGKCAPGACFGVDLERNTCSLDGQYLYICLDSTGTQSLLKMDCYAATGAECGTRGCDCHYDAWSGKNACIEKPPCVPDCEGKECGDDGCGGTCDTCDGGWRCTNEFKCRPMAGAECVWIDWVGTCWSDNWLYVCSSDAMGQGEIIAEDCTAAGKICYFNPSAQQYICGTL